MNRFIVLFFVTFAFVTSACALDHEEQDSIVAPPNGVVVPAPTPSADTGTSESGSTDIGSVESDALPEASPPDTSPPDTSPVKSGELSIIEQDHPASRIVIAGKDSWYPVAQYKAHATGEAIEIDRLAIAAKSSLTWDTADFVAVAVASDGKKKSQSSGPSGSAATVDQDLSKDKILVPKDGEVLFQLWTKYAPVIAWSKDPAKTGVSRSGHAPALGLASGLTTGEWDANYVGMLNLRAVGVTSGKRIYTPAGAKMGNPMVLRKSQPTVTIQSLSSTTLANIDLDLFKFQVAADSAGSVGFKQMHFVVAASTLSEITLSNFRLRRGATDIDSSMYAVTNPKNAADLVSNSLAVEASTPSSASYIVVAFKAGYEETISGSGAIYTLHATVSGSVPKDVLQLSPSSIDASVPLGSKLVTGALTNDVVAISYLKTPNIFNLRTPEWVTTGTFVWSDLSEDPHTASLGTTGGSSDWTNDALVSNLLGSATLTR